MSSKVVGDPPKPTTLDKAAIEAQEQAIIDASDKITSQKRINDTLYTQIDFLKNICEVRRKANKDKSRILGQRKDSIEPQKAALSEAQQNHDLALKEFNEVADKIKKLTEELDQIYSIQSAENISAIDRVQLPSFQDISDDGETLSLAIQMLDLLKTIEQQRIKGLLIQNQNITDALELEKAQIAIQDLDKQQEQLLRYNDALNNRYDQAAKMLATPIDSSKYEQDIVAQLEKSVDETMHRFNRSRVHFLEQLTKQEYSDYKELRAYKHKKRHALHSRQRRLKRAQQKYDDKRQEMYKTSKMRIEDTFGEKSFTTTSYESHVTSKSSTLRSKAKSALARMEARMAKIEQDNAELDTLETNNEFSRGPIMEEWQKKMDMVNDYSEKCSQATRLQVQLHNTLDDNDKLKLRLSDLISQRSKLERRVQIIHEQQKVAQREHDETQHAIQNSNTKKKSLIEKQKSVAHAKEHNRDIEADVDEIDNDIMEAKERLAQLNAQLDQINKQTERSVLDIQSYTTRINAARLARLVGKSSV